MTDALATLRVPPTLAAGDVVTHRRSGRRMFVESAEGRVIYCAWFDVDGNLRRCAYGVDWLVPRATVLA